MKTSQVIQIEKAYAITKANEDNNGHLWPLYSRTYDFKYSPKTGLDHDNIILVAKQVIIRGDHAYFAQRKQAVNNYYIIVMELATGKTDLIHYSDNLKQAVKIIATIALDNDNTKPEVMKKRYYNGSGSDKLFLN